MIVAGAVADVGLVFRIFVRPAHVRIVVITTALSSFAGGHGVIPTEVSMIVKGSRIQAEWLLASSDSMTDKRTVLEALTRGELISVADAFDLQVEDRRSKAKLIEAIASSKKATLANLLTGSAIVGT